MTIESTALSSRIVCFIARGQSEEVLLREYARSGGAPNCAPSLRSVAGLLVAR